MAETVCAKFISKKIRKVRWQPPPAFGKPNPDRFLTGSWDDEVNQIALWDTNNPDSKLIDPVLVSSLSVSSDITDIQFIDSSVVIIGLGNGSVIMVCVGESLEELNRWEKLHQFKVSDAPCTAVICQSSEIATIGEDGMLNLIKANQDRPYKTIDADSCTLNTALYTSQTEILTGNSRGMLKLWDIRLNSKKPAHSMSVSEDTEVGISTMDRHPFQGHIIAIGSYDGMLSVYDMRRAETPVTVLAGPESCLNQVRFHPNKADHVFTVSESGAVWHWAPPRALIPLTSAVPNVWLTGDLASQQLDIKEVLPTLPLPINSIDVYGESLICGGDNEAFYYVPNLEM